MNEKTPQLNQSVEKALHIIEILAHSNESMRLFDIAKAAAMPAPTVFRMLNTLVKCGYAFQECDGSQRYGLTLRFLYIGQLSSSHFRIRDMAHPFLVALAQESGESCCLSVNENGVVRYIDVVESTSSQILIRQRIGGTAKMHCTGSGKVFLCEYDAEKLSDYIREKGLPRLTANTITSEEVLEYDLQKVRARGYALDDEECEIGMRCMSAPIRDTSGRAIAALSLSGPITRMNCMRCEQELIPKLCEYANAITEEICGKR